MTLSSCLLAGVLLAPTETPPETLSLEERTYTARSGQEVRGVAGRLRVPENRLAEGSRWIELAFVRLLSTAARPAAPLIYLAGGPGGSCTGHAESPDALQSWLPYLEVCDVILLDQRGTGASRPSLRWRWPDAVPLDVFEDPAAMQAHATRVHRAARAHFEAEGVDLAGYTSVQSADDIEDLRRALGLPKVSLAGFSYGTHLALATIRRHESSIERVILAGVEGPDHTYKLPLIMDVQFRKLALLVAQDPVVGPEVPDLVGLWEEVLFQLDEEPMAVTLPHPQTREPVEVRVGSFFLKVLLRRDIGDATDLPVIPRLLASIQAGDNRLLQWFVAKRAGSALGVSAMSMIMDGASAASAGRMALIEAQQDVSMFGDVVNYPYPEVNELWQPPDLGEEYRSPLVSSVPALFLSGTLDFNTPPHQAAEVRWGFPDSTHLVVENAGHEQVLIHPEIRGAMLGFLRGEDVSHVRAAWPALRFVPLEGHDPEVTHPSVPEDA